MVPRRCFSKRKSSESRLLHCPHWVATEFLHIVTDGRRFNPLMTQTVALDWIEGFLTLPEVNTVESNEASLHLNKGLEHFNI